MAWEFARVLRWWAGNRRAIGFGAEAVLPDLCRCAERKPERARLPQWEKGRSGHEVVQAGGGRRGGL